MPAPTRSASRPAQPAVRTRRETVTFARPFRLRGVDEPQPAGAYTVETDEEPIEGLSFMAYRRVATVIFLPLARGGPARSKLFRSILRRLKPRSRPTRPQASGS